MTAVLVSGPTATQEDLPFLPQRSPKPPPVSIGPTYKVGKKGLTNKFEEKFDYVIAFLRTRTLY